MEHDYIAKFGDTLNASCAQMFECMREKGFWEKLELATNAIGYSGLTSAQASALVQSIESEKLMLVVGELSEAQEAMRKNAQDDHLPQHMGLAVEVVDAMIRLQDFAGYLQSEYGVNIGQIYADKVAYNASRPHKHGKAF